MSGPIVRKYGFPNFEQIFGKRELEHGVEELRPASSEPSKEVKPKDDSKTKAPENTGGNSAV